MNAYDIEPVLGHQSEISTDHFSVQLFLSILAYQEGSIAYSFHPELFLPYVEELASDNWTKRNVKKWLRPVLHYRLGHLTSCSSPVSADMFSSPGIKLFRSDYWDHFLAQDLEPVPKFHCGFITKHSMSLLGITDEPANLETVCRYCHDFRGGTNLIHDYSC